MLHSEISTLSLKDVLHPRYQSNPYALYKQLRDKDPVYWDERLGGWVLTRYADVQAVLRDARFGREQFPTQVSQLPPAVREQGAEVLRILSRQMPFLTIADHTRLRKLVNKAFTQRRVNLMRENIQTLVERQLDAVEAKGQMDVIADFALPLPVIVIAEMLGVPPEHSDQFMMAATAYSVLLDNMAQTPEQLAQGIFGVTAFFNYFRRHLSKRRAQSEFRDDLLQGLIEAEEQGDTLSEDELFGNCLILLAAGFGTTAHTISNGLRALLQHPEQLEDLRNNLSLMPAAVEELLRYEPPIQTLGQVVAEDLEIGGKQMKAGQRIAACLAAANHDPEYVSHPDQLDLRRDAPHHLSFGLGSYYCLGASLAQLEIEIALAGLLTRFPKLRLKRINPRWEPLMTFRSMKTFPVVFS